LILDDFVVFNDQGLYCRYGDFYLDPKRPVHRAVISHAHADHAIAGNRLVYCTVPTEVVMKYRYGKRYAYECISHGYNESFSIQDVHITFLSAGHIIGSAQVLLEYQGVKYLY